MKAISGQRSANRATATKAALWLALFLTAVPCSLTAVFADGVGGKPGDIYNFGANARALAQGGAYTASAQDASALYYNPAGFGAIPARQLSLMHAVLFGDATYDYIGFGQPFKRAAGGWGAQVVRDGVAGVAGRDAMNRPTSTVQFSETGFGFGAGWGGVGVPELSVGFGIKTLNRKLANSADNLLGVDVGIQYGPLVERTLNLGLVVQNAFGSSSGDTKDKLPMRIKFGAAYKVLDHLSVVGDMSSDSQLAVGTEYTLGAFALRGGYTKAGISVGGGISVLKKALTMDVALLNSADLGLSERVSFGYRFGGAKGPTKQVEVSKDYLAEAKQHLADRDYIEAAASLRRAVSSNPNIEASWKEKAGRIKQLVEELGLATRPEFVTDLKKKDEQGQLGNVAINAWLNGQNAKAVVVAHAALGADPRNATYDALLRGLAKLSNMTVTREDILAPRSLVREKLKRAQNYFYDKRFDLAVRECDDALVLDPNNELAWVRLGSSYFALGDVDQAREAYLKAMELNPSNESVKEFMRLQGWK